MNQQTGNITQLSPSPDLRSSHDELKDDQIYEQFSTEGNRRSVNLGNPMDGNFTSFTSAVACAPSLSAGDQAISAPLSATVIVSAPSLLTSNLTFTTALLTSAPPSTTALSALSASVPRCSQSLLTTIPLLATNSAFTPISLMSAPASASPLSVDVLDFSPSFVTNALTSFPPVLASDPALTPTLMRASASAFPPSLSTSNQSPMASTSGFSQCSQARVLATSPLLSSGQDFTSSLVDMNQSNGSHLKLVELQSRSGPEAFLQSHWYSSPEKHSQQFPRQLDSVAPQLNCSEGKDSSDVWQGDQGGVVSSSLQQMDCTGEVGTSGSPNDGFGGDEVPASTPAQGFAFQGLDCLENLPDVVENLSQAQRQQAAEIERQYQMAQQEKERLQKEQDKLLSIQEELSSCKRRICLAEEEHAAVSKHCRRLETDVETTSLADLQNIRRIQEVKQKIEDDARLFGEYFDKMGAHRKLVQDLEANMPIHVELATQKQKIEELQAEKTAVENDLLDVNNSNMATLNLQLELEMKSIKEKKQQLIDSIASTETEIANENTRQVCIKQDIEVLHKRNNAQLTRLKRQLKEAQLRNQQWHDEACQLEVQMERLRKFTEE